MHFKDRLLLAKILSAWILCALLSDTCCEASNVWDGDLEAPAEWVSIHFKKHFETINKFLIDKLPKDEGLESNLKKANEYYNELLSYRDISGISKVNMIRALNLFVSLGDLDGKAKCNLESYRIILQNDISAGGISHQIIDESTKKSLNRVQKIIHNVSIQHAESCYTRYLDLFKTIFFKLDTNMVRKVSLLLDDYIRSQVAQRQGSDSDKIYHRFVFQSEAMGVWNFARAIYDMLSNEPDLSYWFPKTSNVLKSFNLVRRANRNIKAKNYYRDRVVKPCEYYVRNLREVFIPARYDAVFHRQGSNEDYYMAWARFRLCNGILGIKAPKLYQQVIKIHDETRIKEKESKEMENKLED